MILDDPFALCLIISGSDFVTTLAYVVALVTFFTAVFTASLALVAIPSFLLQIPSAISFAILFTALADARVNIKMIDQGSSELNIIIGVAEEDFEVAMKAIYNAFIKVKK